MSIPEQVLKQGEESDRLIAAAKGDLTVEPVVIDDKPTDEAGKIDPENYKERFVNFKTSADETIRSLREELSQNTGKNEVLTQQVADLVKQLQMKPEVIDPVTPVVNSNISLKERIASVLSEEEKGQYSGDFLDMIGRVVQSVQNSAPAQDVDLVSRVEKVESLQHLSAEDKFWGNIDTGVPDWRELQKLETFQLYLNQYDPLLQATRLEVLKQAQSDLNAERAIAVFMNYKNGSQYQVPIEDDPIVINPLEKHVVPNETGGGNGGDVEVVPMLSLEEINQFYVDVSLGRYKTRPTEMANIENAIRKIHQAATHVEPTTV